MSTKPIESANVGDQPIEPTQENPKRIKTIFIRCVPCERTGFLLGAGMDGVSMQADCPVCHGKRIVQKIITA